MGGFRKRWFVLCDYFLSLNLVSKWKGLWVWQFQGAGYFALRLGDEF